MLSQSDVFVAGRKRANSASFNREKLIIAGRKKIEPNSKKLLPLPDYDKKGGYDLTNSSTPISECPNHSQTDKEKNLKDFEGNFDVILAKEAFYDLRKEAKSYLLATKKVIKSNQSVYEDTKKMYSYSMVETVKNPMQDLTVQLDSIKNQFAQVKQISLANAENNVSLKSAVEDLEKHCQKLRELKLEKHALQTSCNSCLLF